MTNPTKTDSAATEPSPAPSAREASRSVVTECELPDPPEKVWQALTVPKLLARWLPDAVNGEILTSEPNRVLSRRWPASEQDKDASGRALDSVVTFELTGTATGGTHLRVVHRVLASARVIPFRHAVRKEPAALPGVRTTDVTMLLRQAA